MFPTLGNSPCFVVVQALRPHGTAARQAPLSLGFPKQESWSGLPFPSPWELPDPGIEPALLHWQVGSLLLSHQGMHFVYSVFEIL